MGPNNLNHPLKALFCGTPYFAARILSRLLDWSWIKIIAVLTQPDRKGGRGRKIVTSPVKALAAEQGLQVLQPESLRSEKNLSQIKTLAPDVILVAAYGLLLPRQLLELPPLGAINVHASLLPKYRGAAPIQRALQQGEQVTGVSIMQMGPGLDNGPILGQKALGIDINDTAQTLQDELADLGAECLQQTLQALLNREVCPLEQDESRASHAPKVQKEEGYIPWQATAWEVHNHIRAMQPWPGAFFDCILPERDHTLRLTLYPGQIGKELQTFFAPGTILGLQGEYLAFACQDRAYLVSQVKPAAGKILSARSFASGYLQKILKKGV